MLEAQSQLQRPSEGLAGRNTSHLLCFGRMKGVIDLYGGGELVRVSISIKTTLC